MGFYIETNLSGFDGEGVITDRKRSLEQGNVFTRVCHSVRGCIPACTWQRGVYHSMHLGNRVGKGLYTPNTPPPTDDQ